MTNRLARESSPYLLQHAENPVDWYPWGPEAVHRARAENKPIFLSIGYASCHWCHVMAHESFEDHGVAQFLNERFVPIKVDREEHPEIDSIYMSALQAMTGSGGWPMSMFLTPDGKPFYGGTYYPLRARHGLPAFPDVLIAVAKAWETRRDEISVTGERILAAIEERQRSTGQDTRAPIAGALEEAEEQLIARRDPVNGGWGTAPKFPSPYVLSFLLRRFAANGSRPALAAVQDALVAMARGGMYDQVGGGFHRYSVDAGWLVPHFEKMLYDNAGLVRAYLHALQITGRPLFRTIVEETLDFVLREMRAPEGGFYAALDADSGGVEGAFYTWTPAEVEAALGKAPDLMTAYGITSRGNLEGRSVLSYRGTVSERDRYAAQRRVLLDHREGRVRPSRDDKVIVAWNGLMIASLALAGRALERDDYVQAARQCADFLLANLRSDGGRLQHVWIAGQARVPAFLDDHTHLAAGLLALYETTFESRWYRKAWTLVEQAVSRFATPDGFYDTADDHTGLPIRPRRTEDQPVPSGASMATTVLLHVGELAVDPGLTTLATEELGRMSETAATHPLAFAQWLLAMQRASTPPISLAIVGDPMDAGTRALLDVWREEPLRSGVLAVGRPESADAVPLLRERAMIQDRATAYVCIGHTCQPPVVEPEELRALLESSYSQPERPS